MAHNIWAIRVRRSDRDRPNQASDAADPVEHVEGTHDVGVSISTLLRHVEDLIAEPNVLEVILQRDLTS